MSEHPFPKDWQRFIRAAKRKLSGDDYEWCLLEATRVMPLTRLSDDEVSLFAELEDSQGARIDREQGRRKAK